MMIGRRDLALLAASGAALASGGRALAQSGALAGKTYRLYGAGRTTLAATSFDADGVSRKPLWQTHSTGESLHEFFGNGTGRAQGACVTQIGAIFDPILQNDPKMLASQEARFEYQFRYTLGADGSVRIYVVPGAYIREVLKGPRKGLIQKIAFVEPDKSPAFVGLLSEDGRHLSLRHPGTIYTRHADRKGAVPETFGAKQATMHGYLQT